MIGLTLVYVDILCTCGDCGFNFLGSWSYSKEWVWNLETKKYVPLRQGSEILAGYHSGKQPPGI